MAETQAHPWNFFRAGGLDQVRVESGADLAHLGELDLKHWVALACPVKGLEIDSRTLELLDTDHDGRIRAPEIVAAAAFVAAGLKDPAEIRKGAASLPLASIQDSGEKGRALAAAAKKALVELGKASSPSISVEDADAALAAMAKKGRPGTGLVSASSAADEGTRRLVGEILAAVGAEGTRGGEPAVGSAKADAFFQALRDLEDWRAAGEAGGPAGALLLGEATFAAFDAFEAVRAKFDDYFVRCRLAGFEARAAGLLEGPDAELAALSGKTLALDSEELARRPVQHAAPARRLDLLQGSNPAWAERVALFRKSVAVPLFGPDFKDLDEARWQETKARLAAHGDWRRGKKGASVEGLGRARAKELLAGDARQRLEEEIRRDVERGAEAQALDDLGRLVRYHRDLNTVLRNFVNFADFYDPAKEAVFEAGRLFLDQRTCHFCVRVEDAGRHAAAAAGSRLFLAYCECTRPGEPKMTVVAAFTDGDAEYLASGRNGVFYDRKGRDWDATVVRVVENPISLRQAFWAPYKRLARFVEEMVEKYGAAKDKASLDAATGAVAKTAETAPGARPAPAAFDIAKFAGIFAAIGLAIGAIGGALGAMLTAFARLAWWQMPLAVAGILLVISGPSVLLAWLKLRLRSLGPVLEGNGWAVNGRVRINIPLGRSLTDMRRLPLGARLPFGDPFEDRGARRRRILYVVLFLAAVAVGLAVWRWDDLLPLIRPLFERIGWSPWG